MFKIKTTTGNEYTTEHDILRDRLTQWVPCVDPEGKPAYIHLNAIELVEEITEAPPKKTPRKKVETK